MWRIATKFLPVFLFLLFLAKGAGARNFEDKRWLRVNTASFEILSLLSEKDTVKVATHLEAIRTFVGVVSNVDAELPIFPTRIIAVKSPADFDALGVDGQKFAGLFAPGLRENLILIQRTRGAAPAVMLHEYAHYLLSNASPLNYPSWFNEGMAEYFSTTRIRGNKIQIGGIPEQAVHGLHGPSWIYTADIIDPQDYDDWKSEKKHMFYAQSWLLTYYLQHEPSFKPRFVQAMKQYIDRLNNAEDPRDAFEQAFDVSIAKLHGKLIAFSQRATVPVMSLDVAPYLPHDKPVVATVSREQAALELAQVALRLGLNEKARHWFDIANEDPALQAWAQAGIGDTFKFAKQYDKAQAYFEKALELAPDDVHCRLDVAEYWHSRAHDAEAASAQQLGFLDEARKHYVAAWRMDKTNPETYAQFGRTYLLGSARPDRAVELLEEAEYLLPSHLGIRQSLAEAYHLQGRTDDAVKTARSVLSWAHEDSEFSESARLLLNTVLASATADKDASQCKDEEALCHADAN